MNIPMHDILHDQRTCTLATALKIPAFAAFGLVATLAEFAARYAADGAIGRYSDKVIAEKVGWTKSATRLMAALLECRWVRADGQNRIVLQMTSHASVCDATPSAIPPASMVIAARSESNRNVAPSSERSSENVGTCSAPLEQVGAEAFPSVPGAQLGERGCLDQIPDVLTLLPEEDPSENKVLMIGAPRHSALPRDNSRRRGNYRSAAPGSAEAIYGLYPRHEGKGAAIRNISKAINSLRLERFDGNEQDAIDWLRERVRCYAGSESVRTTPKQFIPHPSTWFNQGRYDDDEIEWKREYSDHARSAGHGDSANQRREARVAREYTGLDHVPLLMRDSRTDADGAGEV